ncbi:hypothetical protein JCM11251_000977 [Rhodosporidiobolus azoricus]
MNNLHNTTHDNTGHSGAASKLVCVTGASGFLGSAIALRFLELGHRVRLPLRKKAQAEAWQEMYRRKYDGRLETVLLKQQMQEEGAFGDAVEGCEIVVNAASPAVFTFETSAENDILRPAINGTLSILRSAQKSGTVTSFVLTSSDSAYVSILSENGLGEGDVLDESKWNPITPPRKLSEKALWAFMKDPAVHFTLCTLGPAAVLGKNPSPLVKRLDDLGSSSSELFVSIDSVAEAHVLAALNPSVSAGKRYLLISDRSSLERVVREMVKHRPELKGHYPPLPDGEHAGEGPWRKSRVGVHRPPFPPSKDPGR